MSRRKLLFMDEPYHVHTRSSDFLVELLENEFDVTVDYLQPSSRDSAACVKQILSHGPDLVVLFQTPLRAGALANLGIPAVWVPMFDHSWRKWHQNYLDAAASGVSVLAFSKVVADIARYWDLPTHGVCYYPEPAPAPDFETNCKRLLIWYRGFVQPTSAWSSVRQVRDLQVTIKNDPDPGAPASAREDGPIADRITEVVEGFLERDKYLELTAGSGMFLAPRRIEGIGLSFLEAMARGACVVAYNAPTMNEYIEHGKTGWLIDDNSSDALPEEMIAQMRRAAYNQVVEGRAVWETQQAGLLEFVGAAKAPKRRWGARQMVAGAMATTISLLTPLKHKLFGK